MARRKEYIEPQIPKDSICVNCTNLATHMCAGAYRCDTCCVLKLQA